MKNERYEQAESAGHPRKKKARPRRIGARTWVQIGFFVLITLIAVNHSLEESGAAIPLLSAASLHAVCPFGGVVSLYQWVTTGTLVRKLHESSLILMFIVAGLAVTAGPLFCGWICPFGSLQEWMGKAGKKLFGKKYNRFIPSSVDRYLRFLRYGVLAWVLVMTILTGKLAFEEVDPYYALFNLWSSELAVGGVIALALVILASLFVERPFCKYACPYGALLGLSNLFRIFSIKRNTASCISCGACDRSCPMNIPVSKHGTVRNHQCISCMKCTSGQSCPVPATVEMMTGRFDGSTRGENSPQEKPVSA